MKNIGITANLAKPDAGRQAEEIVRFLTRLGAEVYLEESLFRDLELSQPRFDLSRPPAGKVPWEYPF